MTYLANGRRFRQRQQEMIGFIDQVFVIDSNPSCLPQLDAISQQQTNAIQRLKLKLSRANVTKPWHQKSRSTLSETMTKTSSELAFENVHIYGRGDEITVLKEAYTESSRATQIVWLYGYSGVGKTTLVQVALEGAEHYCHGKFDRLRSAQPYSAIVTLLARLCFILEFGYPTVQVSPDVALILSRIIPDVNHVLSYEKSDETPGACEPDIDVANGRLGLGDGGVRQGEGYSLYSL